MVVYIAGKMTGLHDLRRKVDEMPTIDVEPVRRGRWYIQDQTEEDLLVNHMKCSVCGIEPLYHIATALSDEIVVKKFRYCPYCGTKMDGETLNLK